MPTRFSKEHKKAMLVSKYTSSAAKDDPLYAKLRKLQAMVKTIKAKLKAKYASKGKQAFMKALREK